MTTTDAEEKVIQKAAELAQKKVQYNLGEASWAEVNEAEFDLMLAVAEVAAERAEDASEDLMY